MSALRVIRKRIYRLKKQRFHLIGELVMDTENAPEKQPLLKKEIDELSREIGSLVFIQHTLIQGE